jgi:hypothetical protein
LIRHRHPGAFDADAAGGDVHDGAGEALVGDDQVAAATEDEDGAGGAGRFDELIVGGRGDEAARGTAQAERGVVG